MSQNAEAPAIAVAPAPHLGTSAQSTRRMMIDVLLGLLPVIAMALFVFRLYAVKQLLICVVACLVFEWLFTRWRGRRATLTDGSAAVTGAILALSLPWSAPWYTGVVASGIAVGIGKVLFGGLGQNIFNPAMVGRAFVMISFPASLGAAAYVSSGAGLDVLTQATPLTAAKQAGINPELLGLLLGTTNGSLGETSAIACLLGGLYLCFRRSASWEIPAGCILSVGAISAVAWLVSGSVFMNPLNQLLGGSLLFGAFFIATDPVSSPLTPKGKWLFGLGVGAFIVLLRALSGYPEGVMFAVLLMNAVVPLINRWTVPEPLGGPVPAKK
jgi:electron transport complex protein RnfD